MPPSIRKQLEKLEAQMKTVEPHRFEVYREVDRQPIFAVGQGNPHQLLAMESQVVFLKWVGERLSSVPKALALLLGNGRSGVTWASLVGAISLALANKTSACIYCHPAAEEEVHCLIRTILPNDWIGDNSEKDGSYRLPERTELRVAAFTRPKTWMTDCPIVVVDGYGATEQKLFDVMERATLRLVCGQVPHADDQRRGWVIRVRDHARTAGTLFRFRSQQNQSLGDPETSDDVDEVINWLSPDAEQFWEGTGLELPGPVWPGKRKTVIRSQVEQS